MNNKLSRFPVLSLAAAAMFVTLNAQLTTVLGQGTAFTYQGRLASGANAANGFYDLRFTIYDSTNSPGTLIAGPLTNSTTAVSNGLFTVTLDFGAGVFTGAARWLDISVRTNGASSFTTLTPRQALTPLPYAIFANNASNLLGTLPAAQLSGTVSNGQLASSSVTVSPGTGLSGGGAVALGGSTMLNNAGVLSITGNADITVSAASGNVTLGDTATSANTTSTIVKRDGFGNFSAGAITAASLSGDGSGLNNLNGGSIAGGTVTSAQLAPGAALTNLTASGQSGVPSGALVLGNANNAAAMIAAGYTSLGPAYVGETWLPTPTVGAPSLRRGHTAVWTGKELIIWGGYNGSAYLNDGARYNPISNLWLSVSMTNAPSVRYAHMAVWTGTEMLIWGGTSSTNAGGRYNPVTDTWSPMSTNGAPIGWYYSSAVWSGSEMLVWGGQNGSNPITNSGARYNPKTDTWVAITTNGAPSARGYHSAVWTGTEMIVWGGYTTNIVNTGGRYNPVTDTWATTSLVGAPSARDLHAGVWTGSEMVVWGGTDGSTYPITGGRYNPATDTWRGTTTTGAPVGRYWHWPVAAWTGTEMLVWGGANGVAVQSGGRYNPVTDVWTATTTTGAPAARYQHTATWTDTGYVVFGGFDTSLTYFGTSAGYVPGRLMYLYLRP